MPIYVFPSIFDVELYLARNRIRNFLLIIVYKYELRYDSIYLLGTNSYLFVNNRIEVNDMLYKCCVLFLVIVTYTKI